ncbi:MAG: DUF423 domain-containing protein [Gemmatimonadetes bacterium]|nr:DUF423 domain-containing protein [Gemmatimonadota bacterium]
MERILAIIGSSFGFLAVLLGAFGAHALRERLAPADLEIFETAARYQMYHALAILFVAAVVGRQPGALGSWAGWAFVLGTLVFSGSLYLLVGTGIRGLGAITPIGGLSLLAGWALLIAHLVRMR